MYLERHCPVWAVAFTAGSGKEGYDVSFNVMVMVVPIPSEESMVSPLELPYCSLILRLVFKIPIPMPSGREALSRGAEQSSLEARRF